MFVPALSCGCFQDFLYSRGFLGIISVYGGNGLHNIYWFKWRNRIESFKNRKSKADVCLSKDKGLREVCLLVLLKVIFL